MKAIFKMILKKLKKIFECKGEKNMEPIISPCPCQRISDMKKIFGQIYEGNLWGDKESVSGPGSRVDATGEIAKILPGLIDNFQIKSVLDAACGDFNWMKHLNLNIEKYIGVDVVPEIVEKNNRDYSNNKISFYNLDISVNSLPQADLIICRDCLVHFPFEFIQAAIDNFKNSKSKYLLTTTFPQYKGNYDIKIGEWRWLNFEEEPFNFPKPLYILREDPTGDKSLGLWDLQTLSSK